MQATIDTSRTLNDLHTRLKLSSLWVFVFLNMIFRDLHEFGREGFIEDMMAGVLNGVPITEGGMLVGGIMIATFLLMIPLVQFLRVRINRLANIVIAALAFAGIIFFNPNPDLDDLFFAAVELTALLLIIRLAWSWR